MKRKYLLTILFYILLCSCLSQTSNLYKISTESMRPYLKAGDYVLTESKFETLTYGDIVVYEHRESGQYDKEIYVFRIVALPHDTIQIENEIPIINGKKNQINEIESASYTAYDLSFDRFEELQPNGVKIEILRFSEIPQDTTSKISFHIPSNQYFVMGDFRSNAYDSRYYGPINKKQILGKVIKVQEK
ncbi:signal peptidase I [Dysgonomonas sp. 25]|uniref:signal peptidase I n=1 Tax=Dysgonomonas sp. 25 TaxID=2302933 RepID=UPI0013D502DF|nr:signal peptidase I [Dysgonomonas sp. 25]NDV67913.1 signal peptidase I [Dysgonomonas sp. 25]